MTRESSKDFSPEILRLFDRYVHGGMNRREFLEQAGRLAGAVGAAALLAQLSPNYARAQQVPEADPRIRTQRVEYASEAGHGKVNALLAQPAQGEGGKWPGVVVVHENRGLNPYIEDVARRLASEGFVALAPDGLTSVGGYPGDDDKGRELQRGLDRDKLIADFQAGVQHLVGRAECTGQVGVVGFCFGGLVCNELAVRLPELRASVPFYGRAAAAESVPQIKASLLLHFAENDEGVNATWPAYEAALKQHGVSYTAHTYPGTNHGFHNDTTPRYDEAAAKLAWSRTLEFFRAQLGGAAG